MKTQKSAIHQRSMKVLGLFILLSIAVSLFLYSIYNTITHHRYLPSQTIKQLDQASRGRIISADNYTLSSSQKNYRAVVRGESIAPNMQEVFIRLFSIYSGISQAELSAKLNTPEGRRIRGNIVLSDAINSRKAMQLRSLAYQLRRLGVFRWIENQRGTKILYGLDIVENGENRCYPLGEVMSPILGYVNDRKGTRLHKSLGKKGIERSYEKYLQPKRDGYTKGKRDVVGALIHDNHYIKVPRIDGLDVHLSIPLALQRRIELILDRICAKLSADEIIVGVMESGTGRVLSLASSERFDPSKITTEDIAALNPKFSEYLYEAGSVLKPITLAVALEQGVVTPDTWFDTHKGRLKIGKRYTITDDHKFKALRARDIIVHSSNVGISKIAWRLTGEQFRDGLLRFGITKPSGLDLSLDVAGKLKPLYKLNHKLHRANTAYGYGMLVTFAQLFKAYSAFNNDGVAVTPHLVDYLADGAGHQYQLTNRLADINATSPKSAQQIHQILIEVVKKGTGKGADYAGLEIGGKTGTAHIASRGGYSEEYHSSFFGFANDSQGNRYTIGVLVIKPRGGYNYFASKSAVPTFRAIVDALVELEYLHPSEEPAVEEGEER